MRLLASLSRRWLAGRGDGKALHGWCLLILCCPKDRYESENAGVRGRVCRLPSLERREWLRPELARHCSIHIPAKSVTM